MKALLLTLFIFIGLTSFAQFEKLEATALEKLNDNPDSARIIGYQALKVANGNTEKAVAYKLIALSHDFQGDFQNSHKLAFKALSLAPEPENVKERKSLKADILNDISCTWFEKSQMDSANKWFEKTIVEYKKIGDTLGVINAKYNIAGIRIRWGETDYPIKTYTEAGEYYLKRKEYVRYAMTLKDMGILFFNNEDYDKALKYFNQALPIFKKHNDIVGIGQSYDVIAAVYKKQGKCDQAIPLFQKFVDICNQIENTDYLQGAYENMGSCYVELNQPDKALAVFELVREDIESKQNWLPLTKLYRGISHAYRLKKDFAKATAFSQKSIDVAKANNFQYDLRDAYKLHSENLISIGRFQDATIALTTLDTLNRTLFNQDKDATIKSTEAKYNVKLAEAEKIELREKNQIAALELQNEKKTRGNYILALVVVALIGFGSVTMYGRTRAWNKKLEQVNADKDKLFRIVSHDLRSPLVVLRNRMETITQKDEMLIDNTLMAMDNLLNWTLSQTSGIKYNPSVIDLSEIVDDIVFEFKPMLDQKQITCIAQIEDDAVAWADSNMIKICLRNLLHNAIKFTPIGKNITITMLKGVETGVIISNDFNHSESTYFDSNRTGSSGETGSGIGLTIVSELTRLNSGKFKIIQRDKVIEASLALPERRMS